MARELSVADIARRHDVDRKTAYRWLVEIEKKYGPSVVGRRGKRGVLFTTEDAFARVAPLVASRSREDQRISRLEDWQVDELHRADMVIGRLTAMEREIARLRDQLNRRQK